MPEGRCDVTFPTRVTAVNLLSSLGGVGVRRLRWVKDARGVV
jgi:hypothetical protein